MAGSQDKHGYRYNCKTPKLLRPRSVFFLKLQVPLLTQGGQAKGCAQGVAVGDGAEEIDPDEGAAKGAHPLVRLALGHGTAYLKNPSSNSAMPEVLRARAAGSAPLMRMASAPRSCATPASSSGRWRTTCSCALFTSSLSPCLHVGRELRDLVLGKPLHV